MNNTITFDQQTYFDLKKSYTENQKKHIEVFDFHGHKILTAYAKYLLQYLKPKFEK